MKILCNFLICSLIVLLPVFAEDENVRYDLSSPDKTIESFLKAVRINDVEAVMGMLSPRIKKMLQGSDLLSKEYVKAWNQYPVVRIGKAEVEQSNTDTKVFAGADVVFLINGKEYSSHVGVIKVGNKWLWDEK